LAFQDRAGERAPDLVDFASYLDVCVADLAGIVKRPFDCYKFETRPKKAGDKRELRVPNDGLKLIQQRILRRILQPLGFHAASHCRPGRDVISNALQHVGHAHVVICDIKDAFPSVRPSVVSAALRRHDVASARAGLITRLCTFHRELPQGAPTSPALLDLVLRPVDDVLSALAERHGVIYTRYVDDFCVSANKPVGFFLGHIAEAISSRDFHLARHKTHFSGRGRRATVTGIVLSKRPTIGVEYRRRIHALVDRVMAGKVDLSMKELRSVRASIRWIGRCHPAEAEQLTTQLQRATGVRSFQSS
jgi:hypothetical protein